MTEQFSWPIDRTLTCLPLQFRVDLELTVMNGTSYSTNSKTVISQPNAVLWHIQGTEDFHILGKNYNFIC